MKTKQPEEEKKLKRLLKLLRSNGVKYYQQGEVTIALHDAPIAEAEVQHFQAPNTRHPEFADLDIDNPADMEVLMHSASR